MKCFLIFDSWTWLNRWVDSTILVCSFLCVVITDLKDHMAIHNKMAANLQLYTFLFAVDQALETLGFVKYA